MVRIFPFAALRPSAEHAASVASVITGTETDEETRRFMQENPLTYLHVVKPYVHFGESKSSDEKHYHFARNYFSQLLEQKVLVQDDQPAIYIYSQLLSDGHLFTGIIAGVSAIDYLEGTIKKHEYTLPEKEALMVNHVANTGVVGEPVLLSCPNGDFLHDWIARYQGMKPIIDFEDKLKRRHCVWQVTDSEAVDSLCKRMMENEALYIADGHHRIAASTDYLTRMHNEHNWSSKRMHFMAYILPEEDLWIKPFHRLVKGISQEEVENLLHGASEKFEITASEEAVVPTSKGELGLCVRSGWYRLRFRHDPDYSSPAQNLDVSRLERYIFRDILHITDSKTDPRLQFIRGDVPARDLQTLVHAGTIDAAFLLHPNTMQEIKQVADADETMPPKSTWVEPKLLTGMIIQRFFS